MHTIFARFGTAFALVLTLAHTAVAQDARLEMDRTLDLDALARASAPSVHVERHGGEFYADASAILPVSLRTVQAAAFDIERYPAMHLSAMMQSRVVSAPSPDLQIVWSHMAAHGQESRHYIELRKFAALNGNGGAGLEWELTHRQAGWSYEENTQLTRFEGSIYLEPMGANVTYVRYFMVLSVDSDIPNLVLSRPVTGTMKEIIVNDLYTLGRAARILYSRRR